MKKIIIYLMVLVLIVVIGLLFFNGTNKGKIVEKKLPLETKTEKTGGKVFDGDYIYFEYSDKYDLSEVETTDGRVLNNIMLADKTVGGGKIIINLSRLTQDINDLPSVQIRRLKKDEYSEEVGMLTDLRGLLFRTIDKKERVLFVRNKETILTIAMTVSNDDVTVEKEWQDFLATVRWK